MLKNKLYIDKYLTKQINDSIYSTVTVFVVALVLI